MNIKGFTFEIFYVPHSNKWSVIVKDRGVRIAATFLIECGSTIDEACDKIEHFCVSAVTSQSISDMMNGYENKHRRDAG
jgi:hypothetical protein